MSNILPIPHVLTCSFVSYFAGAGWENSVYYVNSKVTDTLFVDDIQTASSSLQIRSANGLYRLLIETSNTALKVINAENNEIVWNTDVPATKYLLQSDGNFVT